MSALKLLLDQNLSHKLLLSLDTNFPDSTQARLIGLDHVGDATLWRYARDHGYALVTKDSDFVEMSLLYGAPPKVIWLKCGNVSNDFISRLLARQSETITAFLGTDDKACIEFY